MSAKPGEAGRGRIFQIDPDKDDTFGGCCGIVTAFSPKTVSGYIVVPRKGKSPTTFFVEKDYADISICGWAKWIHGTYLVQCAQCGLVIDRADAEEMAGRHFCVLCAK